MSSHPAVARRHYAGLFLLSLATLLLELALTRVLSVALWEGLRERYALDRALAGLSSAFGLATVGGFWLMNRIPFDPFSMLADRRQLLFMPLSYLTLAAPFFCSGLAFALLLTRGSAEVNRLYAFDLAGAGVGCAAIALVMPAVGGSGSVVATAGVCYLVALLTVRSP